MFYFKMKKNDKEKNSVVTFTQHYTLKIAKQYPFLNIAIK